MDVVNEKIIHGKEQFNLEKFTSIHNNPDSRPMSLQHMFQRQNSHTDGSFYGHQAQNSAGLGSPSYVNYSPMMDTSSNMNSSQNNAMGVMGRDVPQAGCTINNNSLDSMNNNNNSMVEHLLSSDSYNELQELVSLLGKW